MTIKEAKRIAKRDANDFRFQHAGVTRDGGVVTSKRGIEYHLSQGTLLVYYNGNWHFVRGKKVWGWKKGRTTATYY